MSEWKECKLGDIADITSSKRIFYSEYVSEGVPFYRSKEVIDKFNKRNVQTELFISEERFKAIKEKFGAPKKDDILLTSVGTLGIPYLVNEKDRFYFKDGNLTWFRKIDKDRVDVNYLFLWLQSKIGQQKLYEITIGSTQPALTIAELKEIDILLPFLPEQHSIASILSSLDDKIDLLHRQNKTLEALAETLFRQWFVEEAEEGGETVRVGDLVHTNIASIRKDNTPKTISYLDTGSLTEGKMDGYQIFEISDAPSRARRIVKHNDILISTVMPDQKHYGILKNPAEDVIASTGFCVITCDKINPHFIYILLTTDEMTEYLHSIAEGSTSTYPSLKPSDIEGVKFQLPSQEKLDAFSEYADNTWCKIDYNQIQIRTLTRLRDTLLPKLMSGEVRVNI
ncbi:MAG: restriction endonuclease subunit S [Euryarchaeota archaeon]|nr:restriction endonuclease subunit S [Euryarchaeota archaeon]